MSSTTAFTFTDLPLRGGGALPEVTLAYVTRGRLARGRAQRDPGHPRLHQRPADDRTRRGILGRRLEHAGRARRADRHRPLFRRLLQHAGVELRLDQCGLDRSAHRQAVWVAVPEDHRGGHRHRAEAAAGRIWG